MKSLEYDTHLWKSGFILGFICGILTTGTVLTFFRIIY